MRCQYAITLQFKAKAPLQAALVFKVLRIKNSQACVRNTSSRVCNGVQFYGPIKRAHIASGFSAWSIGIPVL